LNIAEVAIKAIRIMDSVCNNYFYHTYIKLKDLKLKIFLDNSKSKKIISSMHL